MDLTIVTPALRADDLLERSVRSTMAADAGVGVAVIVVMDGDATGVEARRASGRLGDLPGVRVERLSQQVGSAAASNFGLREAHTPFVGRVDADDVSLPGRFSHQLGFMAENPGVVACGGIGPLIDIADTTIGAYPGLPFGDVRRVLLHRNPIVHSSLIMRTEMFRRAGGYDESMLRMQDYRLLLELALLGPIQGFGGTGLVGYRVHGAQTSRQAKRVVHTLTEISQARIDLARVLGDPVALQLARNALYSASQVVRYLGLRRAGYARALRKTG